MIYGYIFQIKGEAYKRSCGVARFDNLLSYGYR